MAGRLLTMMMIPALLTVFAVSRARADYPAAAPRAQDDFSVEVNPILPSESSAGFEVYLQASRELTYVFRLLLPELAERGQPLLHQAGFAISIAGPGGVAVQLLGQGNSRMTYLAPGAKETRWQGFWWSFRISGAGHTRIRVMTNHDSVRTLRVAGMDRFLVVVDGQTAGQPVNLVSSFHQLLPLESILPDPRSLRDF